MGEIWAYFYADGAKPIKKKAEDPREGIVDGKTSLRNTWAQVVRLLWEQEGSKFQYDRSTGGSDRWDGDKLAEKVEVEVILCNGFYFLF